ncbi:MULTISPECIES: GntR family transcriptional regulator [unclassified Polaromonas]|uniref:GntR family transcriptional regulator n=1 Tax=unclassified Polaromonas TaxID=2638319 RepID=UPI000F0732EB|nr:MULTISPECIES: GntR family transcriptional regulator [unclassified Polaromonas]AYQ29276.1 GntR family transcriptional regulator [Polaromonas sp. SP1]QGJ19611.1 FCD domain-containing protein [Polaromonas sp. Pch-P]
MSNAAHSTASAPISLRAQAYESFQQQIVDANIRPGQFISQRELMQLLGMPLGAVRELIPRLEAEGLLKTVPQRGLQVAHVDLKLINNAFQLRRLLEREAASRFVTTVSDSDLAMIELAHLNIVKRAKKKAIDDALLEDATTVDWGLHDLMIDALGNELISEVYRINSLRVRLIKLEGSTLSPDVLIPAMEEHLWFIDALKRRDAQAVVDRLSHHIDSAHRRVLGLPRPDMPWSLETLE